MHDGQQSELISYDKAYQLENFRYYQKYSILLVKNMLCRKLHCQKVLNLKAFAHKIEIRLRVVIDSRLGTTRVKDAQGTPPQSHISTSILVYEEKSTARLFMV